MSLSLSQSSSKQHSSNVYASKHAKPNPIPGRQKVSRKICAVTPEPSPHRPFAYNSRDEQAIFSKISYLYA